LVLPGYGRGALIIAVPSFLPIRPWKKPVPDPGYTGVTSAHGTA
jgi:hypothetical protein